MEDPTDDVKKHLANQLFDLTMDIGIIQCNNFKKNPYLAWVIAINKNKQLKQQQYGNGFIKW